MIIVHPILFLALVLWFVYDILKDQLIENNRIVRKMQQSQDFRYDHRYSR